MHNIFFLSGAFPPNTGGEFYNYKVYEYLKKSGLDIVYIDLHKKRYLFHLSWIPFVGDLLVSLILAIILYPYKGLLIADHYFSHYLLFTNIINRFVYIGKNIIIVHHFDNYSSFDSFSIKNFLNKTKERISLSLANTIITVSKYCYKELTSLGTNPEKVVVIAPALNREKLQIVSELEMKVSNQKIICVGHCIPRKGIVYLIEAFSQIRSQGFTLHIVGKTDKNVNYYNKVKRSIEELGLKKEVFLHDRLTQNDLNCLYSESEIFVLPSLKEGFGIVLLEAMYYGLPIITTNISAMPELIEEGVNGLLVPAANSQALAEAISKLIENPELRKQMGERGRQQVANSYYWDQTASKFLSIVQSMNN